LLPQKRLPYELLDEGDFRMGSGKTGSSLALPLDLPKAFFSFLNSGGVSYPLVRGLRQQEKLPLCFDAKLSIPFLA